MNTHPGELFVWLLRLSWQASVLVVIILAVQWVFQKQLGARWRYALWFLLIARLLLPILPSSPVSIFNLGRRHETPSSTPAAVFQAHIATAPMPATAPAPIPEEQAASFPPPSTQPATPQYVRPQPAPAQTWSSRQSSQAAPTKSPWFPRWNALQFMGLVWLAGVILFTARMAVQNARFLRRLKEAAPVTNAQILSVLDACRELMGIKSQVHLVESDSVKGPALHGLLQKTLLLPPGMAHQFTEAELRHIFLHELAHIKRNDMPVLAIVMFCKAVHWFNPILWLAFRRMSADREVACDELALSYAGNCQSGPYGETILKLLEVCARPVTVPALVGILEEKQQMRRRILMIANFGQHRSSSLPAIVLAGIVGLVTLTDAQTDQSVPTPAITNAIPATSNPDVDKAQAEYRSAMAVYQQDQELARKDRQRAAAAIFQLGETYRQHGQNEMANELYQRIVDEFPDVVEFSARCQQYLLSLPNPPPSFLFSITNVLYPGGVAVDSAGNIYVSDTRRNRIVKFSSQGEPLAHWGQPGDEDGNFNYPQGLAIDSADHLYVADVLNNRVEKFAADGTFLKEWGEPGSETGQFNRPYNIAVDNKDNVYVVDSENNRSQEFTSDGSYIRTFSGGSVALNSPQGIAVDLKGNVYVGNRNSGRVEKFLSDGTSQPGFDWPGVHDVAVDATGNIYLANASQSCVQEIAPSGTLLTQWGRQGTAPGQFQFLARIAIDNTRGRVLVTDAQNDRVQVFGYIPVAKGN